MKIYVVTSGEYSDYSIEAVFTDPVVAQQYANLDDDRTLEVYDADSIKLSESKPAYFLVYYDVKENTVSVSPSSTIYPPEITDIVKRYFRFTVKATDRIYESVANNGKDSPLLKRIAQEKLSEYLAEHNINRESLCRERVPVWPDYLNYTTSL